MYLLMRYTATAQGEHLHNRCLLGMNPVESKAPNS